MSGSRERSVPTQENISAGSRASAAASSTGGSIFFSYAPVLPQDKSIGPGDETKKDELAPSIRR